MIRVARAGEAEALAALVGRAYAGYVPLLGRRPAPMDDDYGARVATGQARVLEREGAPAGLIVLEARGDHLWIDNVAVEPALHGLGLGRTLLAYAEDEARRLHLPELRLLTNVLMARNIALYGRLGFREVERRRERGLSRVYMARRLDP